MPLCSVGRYARREVLRQANLLAEAIAYIVVITGHGEDSGHTKAGEIFECSDGIRVSIAVDEAR
jgi:hypothetical protein